VKPYEFGHRLPPVPRNVETIYESLRLNCFYKLFRMNVFYQPLPRGFPPHAPGINKKLTPITGRQLKLVAAQDGQPILRNPVGFVTNTQQSQSSPANCPPRHPTQTVSRPLPDRHSPVTTRD
jgi:hypothetical protein